MNLNVFLFESAGTKYVIFNEANLKLSLCIYNMYTKPYCL